MKLHQDVVAIAHALFVMPSNWDETDDIGTVVNAYRAALNHVRAVVPILRPEIREAILYGQPCELFSMLAAAGEVDGLEAGYE